LNLTLPIRLIRNGTLLQSDRLFFVESEPFSSVHAKKNREIAIHISTGSDPRADSRRRAHDRSAMASQQGTDPKAVYCWRRVMARFISGRRKMQRSAATTPNVAKIKARTLRGSPAKLRTGLKSHPSPLLTRPHCWSGSVAATLSAVWLSNQPAQRL
jgi:hypothetical protein